LYRRVSLIGAGVLCLLYICVVANAPIVVLPPAIHDDGWYMTMGRYLSEGQWLGPYNHYTLMKGPGYPLFLAVSSWLGLPVNVAHAGFHCLAVTCFVLLCRQFIASRLLCAALFVLLLWEPVLYGGSLLRVIREGIYGGQVLVVLAVLGHALFGDHGIRTKLAWGALGGLLLGWFWLTREETIWITPGLTLLFMLAAWRAWKENLFQPLLATVGVVLTVFGATQSSYRTMNYLAYGSFVGIELQETNYLRALGAIHSVDPENHKPFVSVTRSARQQIYAVSPAFDSLKPHFEGQLAENWEKSSCASMPASCGEIGSGWFSFALRDAAAAAGHCGSPTQTSHFFGRVADEISVACASGALTCSPTLIAEMPHISWDQIATVPDRLVAALKIIVLHEPRLDATPSSMDLQTSAPVLRFLNYPLRTPTAEESKASPTPAQHMSRKIRRVMLGLYVPVEVVVVVIGLVAFMATVLMLGRSVLLDPCFALGLVSWSLAITRAFLIALIDAMSMPILDYQYLMPANFLLIVGALFFVASAVRVWLYSETTAKRFSA
jgi:hypothetical protein